MYADVAETEAQKCLIFAQISLQSKLLTFFHWSFVHACILYWQQGLFASVLHPALTSAQVFLSWCLQRSFHLLSPTLWLFSNHSHFVPHITYLEQNCSPQMFLTGFPPGVSKCPYNIYIHTPWKLHYSSAPPCCLLCSHLFPSVIQAFS